MIFSGSQEWTDDVRIIVDHWWWMAKDSSDDRCWLTHGEKNKQQEAGSSFVIMLTIKVMISYDALPDDNFIPTIYSN